MSDFSERPQSTLRENPPAMTLPELCPCGGQLDHDGCDGYRCQSCGLALNGQQLRAIRATAAKREAEAVRPWRLLDIIGMKLATNCSRMYPGYTRSVAEQYIAARALLRDKAGS